MIVKGLAVKRELDLQISSILVNSYFSLTGVNNRADSMWYNFKMNGTTIFVACLHVFSYW